MTLGCATLGLVLAPLDYLRFLLDQPLGLVAYKVPRKRVLDDQL